MSVSQNIQSLNLALFPILTEIWYSSSCIWDHRKLVFQNKQILFTEHFILNFNGKLDHFSTITCVE